MFGFVILSHRDPAQTLRLVRTLGALYGDPPIALHHDRSQSAIDESLFPASVRFIAPMVTPWGKWAIVEAMLAAIRLLYDHADPDYFFIISGADYPTAPRAKVEQDLAQSGADAFIDHFDLLSALSDGAPPGDPHLAHHRAPYNLKLEREHYLRAQLKIPIIRFRPPSHSSSTGRYPRLGRITLALPFDTPFGPFHGGYRCWCGSAWFTGSRKFAARLRSPTAVERSLRASYSKRVFGDESVFQTTVCNADDLVADGRTFRYLNWHGAHPIDLGVEHFDEIMTKGAHFTRKFLPSDPVLDLIDRELGVAGS